MAAVNQRARKFMQAMHALCLTDVAMCTPAENPCKYARCLAPYLKIGKDSGQSQAVDRREAESLLCMLVRQALLMP
jgi:hypothetical protein